MSKSKTAAPTSYDLVAALETVFDALAALEPEARAREAHKLWPQVLIVQNRLAELRRSGVRGMRAAGMSLAAIGEQLGMSTSRVKQIEQGAQRKGGS